MTNLVEKVKYRNILRRSINSSFDKASKIINEFTENDNFNELLAIKDVNSTKFQKITKLNDDILNAIIARDTDNEKEIEDEEHFADQFNLKFKTNMIIIDNFVSDDVNSQKTVIDFNVSTPTYQKNIVKLPSLNIKTFNGEPENWQTFIDSFECAVDKNDSLSDVQKMNYLKNLIEGKAASVIKNIKLSNENYKLCLDLLKERYEDKQLLIHSHMKKLLKLEVITDPKDVSGLRRLFDVIDIQVRSLQNLGFASDRYGPLLIPIITSKIPDDLNLIISRKFDSQEGWDINTVLESLKAEICAREKTVLVSGCSEENEYEKFRSPCTSSTLYNQGRELKMLCIFCKKNHKSQNCRIVSDIRTRRNIARSNKLCFVCLKDKHIAKDCRSRIKYFKCDGRHHVALCEYDSNQKDSKNNKNKVDSNPKIDSDSKIGSSDSTDKNDSKNKTKTDSCKKDDKSSLTNVAGVDNEGILLQTAIADIKNTSNNYTCSARILFDSCSQLSYITPELRERLCLQKVDERKLLIESFGNNCSENKLEKVIVKIIGLDGVEIPISCFVKDICAPLTNQNINYAKTFSHIQNLTLADNNPNNKKLKVDLLIGADFYWSVVTNHIIKGKEGPVVLNTKVGYVLSGPLNNDESKNSSVLMSHVMKIQSEFIDTKTSLKNDLNKVWPEINCHDIEENDYFDFKTFQKENIKFNENISKYEVDLPFKEFHEVLNDNYSHSKKRFNSLVKKFERDENLLQDYNKIIKDQLKLNIIEKIPSTEINNSEKVGRVHYMPHRPVVHNDRVTTKVRMVFDASCKVDGPSLNDCLYSGPSLTEPLLPILLRFRAYKIAIIADIEKAFLQISLNPEHRDFVRFLWFNDVDNEINSKTIKNSELCDYRICRVLFGVTSSPFLLQATLDKHIYKKYIYYILKLILNL